MKVSQNEILIFYHPRHAYLNKLVALARTITPHVHLVEAGRTNYSSTNWKQVLDWMGIVDPRDCMDKSSDYYKAFIEGKEYAFEDLIHILSRRPELLLGPIVISGENAVLCDSPDDVFKLQKQHAKI